MHAAGRLFHDEGYVVASRLRFSAPFIAQTGNAAIDPKGSHLLPVGRYDSKLEFEVIRVEPNTPISSLAHLPLNATMVAHPIRSASGHLFQNHG